MVVREFVGKWIEIQNRGAKRKKPTNTTIANSVSNAPTTQRCRQKEYDAARNTKPTEKPMPRKTRAGNHSTCRGESGGKCKASAACLTPLMRFQPIKAVQGTPITSVMTAGIKCQGMVRRGVSSTTGTSYGLAFIGDRCGESRFWVVLGRTFNWLVSLHFGPGPTTGMGRSRLDKPLGPTQQ